GPGLIEFFKNRTIKADDVDKLKKLIRQLGDEDFEKREEASQQLVAAGARAKGLLTEALKDTDPEVRARADECLKKIDQGAGAALIATAVRVLAKAAPEGTAEVLFGYLPSAEDDAVREEIRIALAAVANQGGKANPVLVAGLEDKVPL